ncbi:lectin c-type domain protein [Plakobranchus ocellatus]|uniref:Lectin c-type domain protein n=1 Tax=Plakobranchus ocellatus TaxID=259542 RepID=A0AAV4DUJ0_9GAST|nr:lectin c-type domain protein [Plakobranchus ocellatus]
MSFPQLGLLFSILLAASAEQPDTSNSISLKAYFSRKFGHTLQIKCIYLRTQEKTALRSLVIERAEVGSDGEYTQMATLTPEQVTTGWDNADFIASGQIGPWAASQLEITYKIKNEGYCQSYRCVAEVVSQKDSGRTELLFISKTIQENTISRARCRTTEPPTTTTTPPPIAEQTTSRPSIDELKQKIEECCVTSEDIKNTTETMREFEEELSECSLIKIDVEKNQQEIEELRQQFSNVSLELEQVQENTEQIQELDRKDSHLSAAFSTELERNAVKFEEVHIWLTAFRTILYLDKGQYEISSIFQGRVYIANRADTGFDLYTMNQICITEGGYLVELDSEAEQQFVTSFLGTLGNHLYYTGANDVDNEGNFVYYDSHKPVQSFVWKSREPNNLKGYEDCTNLELQGLNDNNCAKRHRFICEIPVV